MFVIKKSFLWAVVSFFIMTFFAHAATSFDINTIDINEEYQPGVGLPLGNISLVQGEAVIVHLNETSGYKVIADMDIYRGDTVVTGDSARVNILLNDQSEVSVSQKSNLQLNQAVFHPKKKKRSTFINMSAGKARFSVRKLKSFSESRFRVKTVTALIGVRGSDFVIITQSDLTEISAFENTELALTGLEMPDLPPVILHSFEKSSIALGEMPMTPVPLSIEEMDALKDELMMEKPIQASVEKDTLSEKSKSASSKQSNQNTEKKQAIRIADKSKMNASKNSLVLDSEALQPPMLEFSDDATAFENKSKDASTYISEQKHEIATELPEFPEIP
ncbi:secreted protein containing FecR protein domain protein [Candidatus Magnetomorum sp. HK-1]|nr:secreted protein containing FecR protein domain protein [Candidatus Magnetomorum sp. HK-1]